MRSISNYAFWDITVHVSFMNGSDVSVNSWLEFTVSWNVVLVHVENTSTQVRMRITQVLVQSRVTKNAVSRLAEKTAWDGWKCVDTHFRYVT